MHILISLLFAGILSLSFVGQAQAASGTNCVAMYGGGYASTTSCAQITIDKKVLKPGTKEYVDGLSGNDPKYQAGQEVTFEIVVKNVGSEKLNTITVTDTLPQFVTFVSGPGSYDKGTNKLTFVISSLESGASQTFYIKTKVADNVTFPEKGFTCVTNYVNATVKESVSAEDSTLFCIERVLKVQPPVLGVKQTPPTGPLDAALPILMAMGGAGAFLKHKTHAMIVKKRGGVTK
jgi:uncharacterized repeat protein (TIGR01451 family)